MICFDPRQPLPVAEVLEEPSRIVRAARDKSAITWRGEVLLDRVLDERDLLGREGPSHAYRAVAAERLLKRRIDHHVTLSLDSRRDLAPRPLCLLALRRGRRARRVRVRARRPPERRRRRGGNRRPRGWPFAALLGRDGRSDGRRAHAAAARRNDRRSRPAPTTAIPSSSSTSARAASTPSSTTRPGRHPPMPT